MSIDRTIEQGTLCDILHASVARSPTGVMLHHRGVDWSYEQIWHRARAVAEWLTDCGIRKRDRVGILLSNSCEYVVAYFGTLLAGGVAVTLNPDTTPHELSSTLVHCEPGFVICQHQCVRALCVIMRQLPDLKSVAVVGFSDDEECCHARTEDFQTVIENSPSKWDPDQHDIDDLAQIIYTSGTTGCPKGVTLSHRNLAANCRSIIQYLELTGRDSVLVVLPFFYSYGNSLLQTHMAVGGRLTLVSDFVYWNNVVDQMVGQRVTGLSGVPSTYAMLLHRSTFLKTEFPQLRYLTCAGGALAPAVVQRLRCCLPTVKIFLMYGQTEATARLSTLMPSDLDRKCGSIGRGIPGVELSVLNELGNLVHGDEIGEITARGENVMVGYWRAPGETRRVLSQEGLRTGDLGRVDEDGYIFVVGRANDIIKCGAYRLNPKEIEDVILELEGIAEVAVVGLPDEIWGESPVAIVVPSNQNVPPTAQEVMTHCRGRLPRYKVIHGVHFASVLPRTASGKIRRNELRDEFIGLNSRPTQT